MNLLVSFICCCFGVVTSVLATVVLILELCKKIDDVDDDAADEVAVTGLSSSFGLLILTAPLLSRLSSSWPFCKIIWPFSVRAPRIKIILLACCC